MFLLLRCLGRRRRHHHRGVRTRIIESLFLVWIAGSTVVILKSNHNHLSKVGRRWKKEDLYTTPQFFIQPLMPQEEQKQTSWNVSRSNNNSSSSSSRVTLFHNDDTINNLQDNLPWQNSTILPPWMKDYFTWHYQQRSQIITTLPQDHFQQHRFLIVQCLLTDSVCGGASDRLQPLPLFLLLAHQSQRILLIKWDRPSRLEEFLLPATPYFNWSVPSWMDDDPHFQDLLLRAQKINKPKNYPRINKTNVIVTMRLQMADHGAQLYNAYYGNKNNKSTFAQVFRECWWTCFRLAPPVQARFLQTQQQLGLVSSSQQQQRQQQQQYAAVHIRSMYVVEEQRKAKVFPNAINCGYQFLRHRQPRNNNTNAMSLMTKLFVASDSKKTLRRAMAHAKRLNLPASARLDEAQPLHLDRGSNMLRSTETDWMNYTAKDYYDVWVDLYLLADAQCIAFNKGGFGRWANLLSADPNCFVDHMKTECDEPIPYNNNVSQQT